MEQVEELEVYCRAKSASSLTGVEMEALVGIFLVYKPANMTPIKIFMKNAL